MSEIAEEYASSLADLTMNSKPLINMLTILAEENAEHAEVIVETVEKHLEKVPADMKLPVLYLVDSIIKNVGGAYTARFTQSVVNMFTKTFKQVDEKVRSQMFKLRETWHDVFPSSKLYQLDVKVNLIDPAWPIQSQHQPQSKIHPTTSKTALTDEDEQMRSILAKKEQELLMLQQKKVEMELEQTRRQMADKSKKNGPTPGQTKVAPLVPAATPAPLAPITSAPLASVAPNAPVAMVNPVHMMDEPLSVKQRLGPPVNNRSRIAPVSAALAGARRDPRLARRPLPPRVNSSTPIPPPPPAPPALPAPNVFDIKPLERAVTKRNNVITIDVRPELRDPRQNRDRLRRKKIDERRGDNKEPNSGKDKPKDKSEKTTSEKTSVDVYIEQITDFKKINKLPPIPKIQRDDKEDASPIKKKKEVSRDKKKKRAHSKDSSSSSSNSSPEKRMKLMEKKVNPKEGIEGVEKPNETESVSFKELKNYNKHRYMRRNKQKSESPESIAKEDKSSEESTSKILRFRMRG